MGGAGKDAEGQGTAGCGAAADRREGHKEEPDGQGHLSKGHLLLGRQQQGLDVVQASSKEDGHDNQDGEGGGEGLERL
jgi:hypothetical protein